MRRPPAVSSVVHPGGSSANLSSLWLAAHPLEAAQRQALRPQGPLALSHIRGKGALVPIPCRYDFIYITPDFSVSQIHYLYDEAISAGSDHAMVMSDLIYTS